MLYFYLLKLPKFTLENIRKNLLHLASINLKMLFYIKSLKMMDGDNYIIQKDVNKAIMKLMNTTHFI